MLVSRVNAAQRCSVHLTDTAIRYFLLIEYLFRESCVGVVRYSTRIRRQMQSLSGVGLAMGALLFAAALTPTLVPRSYLTNTAKPPPMAGRKQEVLQLRE
jgi:uncharacterized membrane protein